MEEPDVPDFPGWFGEADHEPEACTQAVMRLDRETRIFQVVLEGPADGDGRRGCNRRVFFGHQPRIGQDKRS